MAKQYALAARRAEVKLDSGTETAETAMTAVKLGQEDAEIRAIKKEIKIFERQGKTSAAEASGAAEKEMTRSESEIARSIGKAILQDDPHGIILQK